jgi:hypothetical protein
MGSGGDWSFTRGKKGSPKLFSHYEVLERIGEGTLGKVYKGRQKATDCGLAGDASLAMF